MLTKFATTIATASVILFSLTPLTASADTQVLQEGNGAYANSDATITNSSTSNTNVSNTSNVTNNNTVVSNSGHNTESFNNGGSSITTGSVTTDVTNTTLGGTNVVDNSCGCSNPGDTLVNQSGNAAFANSTASVSNSNTSNVTASNTLNVTNNNDIHSNTGYNTQSFGNAGLTGGGDSITTGAINTSLTNSTAGGTNVVSSGAGAGAGASASNSVTVLQEDNGPFSDSSAVVTNRSRNNVDLSNNERVTNNNDVTSNTGYNDSTFNNGGGDSMTTGPITVSVKNNTLPQFNAASGCGCDFVGDVKVVQALNAAFADSTATLTNASTNNVTASNSDVVRNNNDLTQNTGYNSATFNNAGLGVSGMIDPTTGYINQGVSNTSGGQSNEYGNGLTLPTSGGGSVTVTGDMSAFFAAWTSLWSSMTH